MNIVFIKHFFVVDMVSEIPECLYSDTVHIRSLYPTNMTYIYNIV